MTVTLIQSPDIITNKIEIPWSHLSAKTIERLVVELYQADYLTFMQVHSLLQNKEPLETYRLLISYGCELLYDLDDWKEDRQLLAKLYPTP